VANDAPGRPADSRSRRHGAGQRFDPAIFLRPRAVNDVPFLGLTSGFWHNDTPNACFIVDDPLLKRRYGFLDYRKLLEVMERKRFSTSIAFIPWNYRRSNRRITKLLAAHPRKYSLCVHGCEHTAREFGSTNQPLLEDKAQKHSIKWPCTSSYQGFLLTRLWYSPKGSFQLPRSRHSSQGAI